MHVLLIHPPVMASAVFAHSVTPHMPLGLAYIAGSLDRAGYRVSCIDAFVEGHERIVAEGEAYAQGLSVETLCDRAAALRPDIFMLSMPFSIQAVPALRLARALKERFPQTPIVVGGPHASVAASQLMQHPFIDVVVRGEGELVSLDIVRRLEAGRNLQDVPGLLYRRADGSLEDTGPPRLITDLDALAFPLWQAFDHQRIHALRNEKSVTVITSRGCPYSCCFCSIQQVMGRGFRARSPKNVIAELDIVVTRYGARIIYFEDDNLTLDKERAKQLFRLMIDRDYGIIWLPRNGLRMDTLDPEMLDLMKRSGCGRVWIAPESGSPRILSEVINKKLDPALVYDVARMVLAVGIPLTCFFVLGFPQETRRDFDMTFDMALRLKSLGVDDFWFSCAVPYLGTRLFDMCRSLRPEVDWEERVTRFSTHIGVIATQDFTAPEVQRLRDSAMALLNAKAPDGGEPSVAAIYARAREEAGDNIT